MNAPEPSRDELYVDAAYDMIVVSNRLPVDYQPEPPVQPPTLAMVYGYELATNEITDKVRKWVKDYAYAEDDMVVTEEAVRELLDLLDPDWRSVFAG